MSEQRTSDERNGPATTSPDDQLVGDDESGYGGAGAKDTPAEEQPRPGNGHNRPPSERDDDQGI